MTAAELFESANAILAATPVPQWWKHNTLQVLELGFPEWDVLYLSERRAWGREHNEFVGPAPRSTPVITGSAMSGGAQALLRHREHLDRWLLVSSGGDFLLPGRGSTYGQWFRFKPETISFSVGTVDDVLRSVRRRYHPDAYTGLLWWLLDALTDLHPDAETRAAQGFTFDIDAEVPLWGLFTRADTYLKATQDEHNHDQVARPASTRDLLALAFPEYAVVGVHEEGTDRACALLRRRGPGDGQGPLGGPVSDDWLYLYTYGSLLLGEVTSEGVRVRGSKRHFEYPRAVVGSSVDLIEHGREMVEHWNDQRELGWLLRQFSNHTLGTGPSNRPSSSTAEVEQARAWREEAETMAAALAALSPDEQRRTKHYSEAVAMLAVGD